MFELKTLKNLLKQYPEELKDILDGFDKVIETRKKSIILGNSYGETIFVELGKKYISFFHDDGFERIETFLRLLTIGENEQTLVTSYRTEYRDNGILFERNIKQYGLTRFGSKRLLMDVWSNRYAIKNINMPHKSLPKLDNWELEKISSLTTKFETHMKIYFESAISSMASTTLSTHTFINSKDISRLYGFVEGPDKINRIWDLYNGVLNRRNINDIRENNIQISFGAFDLRSYLGIKKKEESLIGKQKKKKPASEIALIKDLLENEVHYEGPCDYEDSDSLLKAITHAETKVEEVKDL